MPYYVGAYASTPCTSGWDPELEARYYDALKALDTVKGLEHPFFGESLHAHDDDWFLQNISPDWTFVFTCVPGTMGNLGKMPEFGIASDDANGREAALSFLKRARDAVEKLNTHAGRQVVRAVEVQTAPNRSKASSSTASLIASLETILSWDWQGARIVIEHCDTYVEGQTPAKGFLSLAEEIEAIEAVNKELGSDVGVVINWGRSVIETRAEDGALEHIKRAKDAGVLAGLMFSGVSATETAYGQWSDTHMPAAPSATSEIGVEGSLMTEEQIHRCIQAAGGKNVPILGVKIGIRPKDENLDNRVAYNRAVLAMIESA